MDERKIYLKSEGDAWFLRQADLLFKGYHSKGIQFLDEFLERLGTPKIQGKKILEIGCSSGYNLAYICEKRNLEGFGVEPSEEAVKVGTNWAAAHSEVKLHLYQGISDDLPFEDGVFDIVTLGFCLYCTDRRYLQRSISEADRVLKNGGFLVIEDFQTPIAFVRPNRHDKNLRTYKYDYAKLFLSDPCYSLIERTTYSSGGVAFDPDMQERVSTSILYKENLDDAYIFRE